jgi:hypothetical protein
VASDDHGVPVERTFGWWDMFVAPEEDPRADGRFDNDERSMLVGYLADRRLTFEMKCGGLDAEGMARQSVPPSNLSLLGLVRHLAGVERAWFRGVMAGESAEPPYPGSSAFEVAKADAARVAEGWECWRSEVSFAERFVDEADDLGMLGKGRPVPLRAVMIHMIEEYARHNGHADLLRERIDGRVGQ